MISIIIPSYNAEKQIAKSIDSVIAQSYQDWELLVIDGDSTDDTKLIVEKYTKEDNRVKWFSAPDKGIYDAMNKGIAKASGDWLYFLGSDDKLYDEEVLSNLFATKEYEKGIVSGKVWFKNNWLGKQPEPWMFWSGYPHQAVFFHRSTLEKYQYTDKYRIFGDQYLMMQIFSDTDFEWQFVDTPVAYYTEGGFSGSIIDVSFANDAEKNMRKYFPTLTGKARFLPLRKRAFDVIKKGKWHLGVKWLILGGLNWVVFKDMLYCFKFRLFGK